MPRCDGCALCRRRTAGVAAAPVSFEESDERMRQAGSRVNPPVERSCVADSPGISTCGWANSLPIVIIPGFGSSGLQVVRSAVKPSWERQRIWLGLQKLGLAKFGPSVQRQKRGVKKGGGGTLLVRVKQAKNLAAADRNGLSDPLVRLTLLDASRKRLPHTTKSTSCIQKTLNPVWDEDIVLGSGTDITAARYLLAEVLDRDIFTHDGLGNVLLPLEKHEHGHLEEVALRWHKLEQGSITGRVVTGTIQMSICYDEFVTEAEAANGLPPTISSEDRAHYRKILVHNASNLDLGESEADFTSQRTHVVVEWNGKFVAKSPPGGGNQAGTDPEWGPFECVVPLSRARASTGVRIDENFLHISIFRSTEAHSGDGKLLGCIETTISEKGRARRRHGHGSILNPTNFPVRPAADLSASPQHSELDRLAKDEQNQDGAAAVEEGEEETNRLIERNQLRRARLRTTALIYQRLQRGRSRHSAGTLKVSVQDCTSSDDTLIVAYEAAAVAAESQSDADGPISPADRSMWLKHLLLGRDGHSDQPGIQVRPYKGVSAITYLEQGVASPATYVFGPVVEYLQNHGYSDKNLRAAPYDWRLAIPHLEKRDKYFTGLMNTIEELYEDNDNKSVVIMTHSMGCKVAHYFMYWIKFTQQDGQAWLDKHVHSMLPISGPFLGARKSFRAVLTGEDFGLGTFLTNDEVIELSRTSGSGPFLFPEGPLVDQLPVHTAFTRDDGVLLLRVNRVDLRPEYLTLESAQVEVEYTKINRRDRNSKQRSTLRTKTGLSQDGVIKWNQIFQFVTNARPGAPTTETITFSLRGRRGGESQINLLQQTKGFVASVDVPLAGLLTQQRSTKATANKDGHTVRRDVGERGDMFSRGSKELMEQLGEVDLDQLSTAFRAAVQPRSHYADYKKFNGCFSGHEASEWLRFWLFENRLHCTLRHAEALANKLMQQGLFLCVDPTVTSFSRRTHDSVLFRYLEAATPDVPTSRGVSNKSEQHKPSSKSVGNMSIRSMTTEEYTADMDGGSYHRSQNFQALPTLYRCCAQTGVHPIGTESMVEPGNESAAAREKRAEYRRDDVIEVVTVRGQRLETNAGWWVSACSHDGTQLFERSLVAEDYLEHGYLRFSNVSSGAYSGEPEEEAEMLTEALCLVNQGLELDSASDNLLELRRELTIRLSNLDGRSGSDRMQGDIMMPLTAENSDVVGWLHVSYLFTQTAFNKDTGLEGHKRYTCRQMKKLLEEQGCEHMVELMEQVYEPDPLFKGNGPAHLHTFLQRPPCRRLFHIYGVDLNTEIGYLYRYKHGCELQQEVQDAKSVGIVLDKKAEIDLIPGLAGQCVALDGGIIYETPDTIQTEAGGHRVVRRSGDGVVPYISMRYPQCWDGDELEVKSVELQGQEHRDILGSYILQKVLAQYLLETIVVFVYEARNLTVKDCLARSSDPFVAGSIRYSDGSFGDRQRTKTIKRNLNPVFNDTFVFGVNKDLNAHEGAEAVCFDVYDYDFGAQDDWIGGFSVQLADILQADGQVIHGWFPLTKSADDRKLGMRGELRIHIEFEGSGQSFKGVQDALDVSQRDDHSIEEEASPSMPTVTELRLARGGLDGCLSARGWYHALDQVWPAGFRDWKGKVLIEGWLGIRNINQSKHQSRRKMMEKVSRLGASVEDAAQNLVSRVRDTDGTHGALVDDEHRSDQNTKATWKSMFCQVIADDNDSHYLFWSEEGVGNSPLLGFISLSDAKLCPGSVDPARSRFSFTIIPKHAGWGSLMDNSTAALGVQEAGSSALPVRTLRGLRLSSSGKSADKTNLGTSLLETTGFTLACASAADRVDSAHEFCCLGSWSCRRYHSPIDEIAAAALSPAQTTTAVWEGQGRLAWWLTLSEKSVRMRMDGQIWEADKLAATKSVAYHGSVARSVWQQVTDDGAGCGPVTASRAAMSGDDWGNDDQGSSRTLEEQQRQLLEEIEADPDNPALLVRLQALHNDMVSCRVDGNQAVTDEPSPEAYHSNVDEAAELRPATSALSAESNASALTRTESNASASNVLSILGLTWSSPASDSRVDGNQAVTDEPSPEAYHSNMDEAAELRPATSALSAESNASALTRTESNASASNVLSILGLTWSSPASDSRSADMAPRLSDVRKELGSSPLPAPKVPSVPFKPRLPARPPAVDAPQASTAKVTPMPAASVQVSSAPLPRDPSAIKSVTKVALHEVCAEIATATPREVLKAIAEAKGSSSAASMSAMSAVRGNAHEEPGAESSTQEERDKKQGDGGPG